MTVQELINKLNQFPPLLEVVIPAVCEEGFDRVGEISVVAVALLSRDVGPKFEAFQEDHHENKVRVVVIEAKV